VECRPCWHRTPNVPKKGGCTLQAAESLLH
jgi:hypothetical protein